MPFSADPLRDSPIFCCKHRLKNWGKIHEHPKKTSSKGDSITLPPKIKVIMKLEYEVGN